MFLIVKLAAIIVKFANNWRHVENAFVQIKQIDAPLARLGVIQPERLRLDVQMLLWIVDLELFKISVAVEKLLVIGDAVILDPIVGTDETIRKPAHVGLPVADEEIEVV